MTERFNPGENAVPDEEVQDVLRNMMAAQVGLDSAIESLLRLSPDQLRELQLVGEDLLTLSHRDITKIYGGNPEARKRGVEAALAFATINLPPEDA